MEKYMTIARGVTPEDAFRVAQNAGLNGKEIQTTVGFEMLDVPENLRPYEFAFELLKNQETSTERAMCLKLREADPSAPKEHYFISQRINAYLFFGYA